MKLSKNFSLDEFIRSEKAKELGIENNPDNKEVESILLLVQNILQPLRDIIQVPIIINSGFRCEELNKHTPNSSPTSQHRLGEAADIVVKDYPMEMIFKIIRTKLIYDQLIWEFGGKWIHVSYRQGRNRKQTLLSYKDNNKVQYEAFEETTINPEA
jgi:hypothetical protein